MPYACHLKKLGKPKVSYICGCMKSYFRILGYVRSFKMNAGLNVLFNILMTIFNLLSLLMFIPFLRLLFDNVDLVTEQPEFAWSAEYPEQWFNYVMSSFIIEHGKAQALLFVCICVGALFFLKNLTRYLAMFFLAPIRNGVVHDLRKQLNNKILELPLSYYSEEKKGDLLARITNDVTMIEVSIMSTLELIFREPIAIFISLVVLFYISTELTLISLVLMPISALVIGYVGKSLRRTSAKGQKKMGDLISNIEETLGGLRIIKGFNAENHVGKKFDYENHRYRVLSNRMLRKRDLAAPMSEFLGAIVMIVLVWFGGQLVFDSEMNGEHFFGFVIVFSQLLRPLQAVSTAYTNIQKGTASIDRINEVLNAKNPIVEKENAFDVKLFNDSVRYENVSFRYEKELVLRSVNVQIKKGQTVALVGQSGSGKSTFADLLPRFYDVTEGQITIDGKPVTDLKIKSLRSLLGIVTQESILFNDSIYNNIAFGKPGATMEKVVEAAKIANAHEFIEPLENGYHTNIGDRGGKLSGGQRQRLSIARAVLSDPPILILDEATSALDTESERLVQEALENLMRSRTSIVIAHRLSTIQHADEILVMKQGEVVERGTHNELLAKNGEYKKLYDLQSFA